MPPRLRRPGYTLLELLMAIAVIAVLVGITVPGAIRMYGDSKLSEAAELVRAQIAGTRTRAIESGLACQFRYEPEGQRFLSCPFEREFESTNPNAIGTGGTTGVGKFSKFAGELPKACRFIACCTGGATGGGVPEEFLNGLPNAQNFAQVSWAPPILFFPDGTATDAAFELIDNRNTAVRFEVRAVSGAVRMSQITQETKR